MSIWPTRVTWPRRAEGGVGGALPALVTSGPRVMPYVRGLSRFTLSPLALTYDQLLFLIVAALLAMGLVMVESADARVHGVSEHWLRQAIMTKNFLHAGIALLVMGVIWRLDYRWLVGKNLIWSPATWLVLITLGCLVLVLTTPLGKELNGARRWLGIGPLGFQPSELAKLGLVLFIAVYAVHREKQIQSLLTGYLPLLIVFGMVVGLIVKEDFGTTVLIAMVCWLMLIMAGCRWWHAGALIPPAIAGGYLMLFKSEFRRTRMLAFLDPEKYIKTAGYHPWQSMLTIMSGGMWGRGLGNGIQKMGYLPEGNTDFIFAVICEELGLFGALVIAGLFFVFVLAGWRIAARCNTLFGKMVAFGITATIGLQAAMNIAVVTVSMPTKGIALPLISSGGTGWIMTAAAVGVLMSVERVNRMEARRSAASTEAAEPQGFPVELKVQNSTAGETAAAAVTGEQGGAAAA